MWTYKRGIQTASITFVKSDLPPQIIDSGGHITEMIVSVFRCVVSDFTAFGTPQSGDKITDGTNTYSVQALADKCYHTIGGMLHINTKQVI